MKFPLVGMSHRFPANAVLGLLPPESPLYLVREPSNQYDPNAIQVWVKNFAALTDEESVDAVRNDCIAQERECPDLTQPFMLGYIKAQSIDEEVVGADILAPRIDGMVESGEIESASDIPCQLIYGSSGRPAVAIVEPEEDIDTSDVEEDEEDAPSGEGESDDFASDPDGFVERE